MSILEVAGEIEEVDRSNVDPEPLLLLDLFYLDFWARHGANDRDRGPAVARISLSRRARSKATMGAEE